MLIIGRPQGICFSPNFAEPEPLHFYESERIPVDLMRGNGVETRPLLNIIATGILILPWLYWFFKFKEEQAPPHWSVSQSYIWESWLEFQTVRLFRVILTYRFHSTIPSLGSCLLEFQNTVSLQLWPCCYFPFNILLSSPSFFPPKNQSLIYFLY